MQGCRINHEKFIKNSREKVRLKTWMNLKTQESDLNLIHKHNYRVNHDDSIKAEKKEVNWKSMQNSELTVRTL